MQHPYNTNQQGMINRKKNNQKMDNNNNNNNNHTTSSSSAAADNMVAAEVTPASSFTSSGAGGTVEEQQQQQRRILSSSVLEYQKASQQQKTTMTPDTEPEPPALLLCCCDNNVVVKNDGSSDSSSHDGDNGGVTGRRRRSDYNTATAATETAAAPGHAADDDDEENNAGSNNTTKQKQQQQSLLLDDAEVPHQITDLTSSSSTSTDEEDDNTTTNNETDDNNVCTTYNNNNNVQQQCGGGHKYSTVVRRDGSSSFLYDAVDGQVVPYYYHQTNDESSTSTSIIDVDDEKQQQQRSKLLLPTTTTSFDDAVDDIVVPYYYQEKINNNTDRNLTSTSIIDHDDEKSFHDAVDGQDVPYQTTDLTSITSIDDDEDANNASDDVEKGGPATTGCCSGFTDRWRKFVHSISIPIEKTLLVLTGHAAHHPRLYIVVISLLAMSLLIIGLSTNFYLESSENELWKPTGSPPDIDGYWFDNYYYNEFSKRFRTNQRNQMGKEAYKKKRKEERKKEREEERKKEREEELKNNNDATTTVITQKEKSSSSDDKKGEGDVEKFITVLLHAKPNNRNDNVVNVEGASKLMDIVNSIQTFPPYHEYCSEYGRKEACPDGYDFLCALSDIPYGSDALPVCDILGISAFWFHNKTLFENQVKTDQDVGTKLSTTIFPGDDTQFNIKHFVGHPEFKNDTDSGETILDYGVSYATVFIIDRGGPSTDVERQVLDLLLDIRHDWATDPTNPYVLELFASVSFPDEFNRGIVKDIPLVPMVFVVMSIFTCLVFFKRDAVESRSLLGLGAVVCVLLSIMTGYGLMFCLGVPFTSLTQVVPFVIFGIGLDDSYILISAYSRTNHEATPVERVKDTVDEVGMSIFMTTATSVLAFGLGCMSSLPAIRWLCLYAFTTILIDFYYQITFFIAMVVLDERRIQENRRDCLVCCKVKRANDDEGQQHPALAPEPHIAEIVMAWYAERLFHPWVKPVVLASFTALFVVCGFSASQLRLEFDFTSVLPDDSYIIPFNDALLTYSSRPTVEPFVFFRNVDQSDPAIQAEMESYIDDLVSLPYVSDPPFRFWLYDFREYVKKNEAELEGLTFNQTIHLFIRDPEYNDYKNDFTFDKFGLIKATRTKFNFDNLDQSNVDDILGALRGQRRIGSQQPINQQGTEWAFFTFDPTYYLWEFLSVTVSELRFTTIIGIVAVSAMGVLFLPHWSGVMFVGPLITILYVDLMGVLQLAGIAINGVSYVALVMSIGLLVDFIVHFAHQFFESKKTGGKEEKAKDVLRTMGSAILLGGVSTFLGVMPLALASNEVLRTIFVTFVGIVTLGVGHGLIFFPVVLSYLGPD